MGIRDDFCSEGPIMHRTETEELAIDDGRPSIYQKIEWRGQTKP